MSAIEDKKNDIARLERKLQTVQAEFDEWKRNRLEGRQRVFLTNTESGEPATGIVADIVSLEGLERSKQSVIRGIVSDIKQARADLQALRLQDAVGARVNVLLSDCWKEQGGRIQIPGNSPARITAQLGPFVKLELERPADLAEPGQRAVTTVFSRIVDVQSMEV